jgi:hypothetical protein
MRRDNVSRRKWEEENDLTLSRNANYLKEAGKVFFNGVTEDGITEKARTLFFCRTGKCSNRKKQ